MKAEARIIRGEATAQRLQFPAAEDVAPETLVDREVLHVLPKAAVFLPRDQIAKLR